MADAGRFVNDLQTYILAQWEKKAEVTMMITTGDLDIFCKKKHLVHSVI